MSTPDANGASSDGPPEPTLARSPPPLPLVLSIVAGAAGLILLIAAAVAGNTGLSVAGVVAGSLSLGAALYWRSMLISAWSAQKRARPPG